MNTTMLGRLARSTLLGLFVMSAAGTGLAADHRDDEIKALRELVRALEQRVAALEADRTALPAAPAPVVAAPEPASRPSPRVGAKEPGFSVAPADETSVLRIHALVQLDGRWFPSDGGIAGNDTFLIRRGRLGIDGRVNRVIEFQVTPEFAGSSPTLLDANLNLAWRKSLQVRAGRFKAPVGLEQLQSDPWALFAERAFPSQLTTSRDLGVLLHGELAGGRTSYALGIFNGVGDGGSAASTDVDDHKDVVGRVFVQPFRGRETSVWSGLGFGLGVSTGRQTGATGVTSGYRTDGQQTFFRYRSGVVADGSLTRLAPQASWYRGPVGVMAEFTQSRADVRLPAVAATASVKHEAWQLAGGLVLTGENASYRGVVPYSDFDPANGGWGAWELTARYSRLELDAGAFPIFADPAASATSASAIGLGVNWYLTRTLRATLDYFRTEFDRAPGAPAVSANPVLQQDEHAVLSRLQVTF